MRRQRQARPAAEALDLARRAAARCRIAWTTRQSVRQARRFRRARPAAVLVCWDLDNTLVGSGLLLRSGSSLELAVSRAEPVANMLTFYRAVAAALPAAEHFVLTARPATLRTTTLEWLARYELAPTGDAVCCVPVQAAKVPVWRELSRGAHIVIVDDLSYHHERDVPGVHDELVEIAPRVAAVYVGLADITAIERNPTAIEAAVARITAAVDG